MEWQPIQTAPKTGKPIIVLGSHGGFERFGDQTFKEFHRVTVAVWDKKGNRWEFDDDWFESPSHWTPLEVPNTGKAGAA